MKSSRALGEAYYCWTIQELHATRSAVKRAEYTMYGDSEYIDATTWLKANALGGELCATSDHAKQPVKLLTSWTR